MQTNLQDALTSIITDAASSVKSGISFLSAQVPDVVHQLLVYKMVSYSVTIGLLLALIITFIIYVCIVVKKWDDADYESQNVYAVIGGIAGIVTFFSAIFLIQTLYNFLELYFAPKVWLIEYAASLLQK
jgi:uncharacterized membrane protein YdcZ (DUF606 family)